MLRIYKLLESWDFKRETVNGRYKLGPYVRDNVVVSVDPYKKSWAISACVNYPFKVFNSDMDWDQLFETRQVTIRSVASAHVVASELKREGDNLWEDEDDDE